VYLALFSVFFFFSRWMWRRPRYGRRGYRRRWNRWGVSPRFPSAHPAQIHPDDDDDGG
jgi:hypothetical protein